MLSCGVMLIQSTAVALPQPMWTWASMRPGMMVPSSSSYTSAVGSSGSWFCRQTSRIRLSSSTTAPFSMGAPPLPSSTRPFRTIMILLLSYPAV